MKKKVLGEDYSEMLVQFTHGLDVDQLMYEEELLIQQAWVKRLYLDKYITENEQVLFSKALDRIKTDIENKSFCWKMMDEDIHMNIERTLTEQLGDLGKKIHLGRSRNDLVATTQRLFVHNKILTIRNLIPKLLKVICEIANKNIDVIIPGMTHQQSGQPVRYSHTLLAHGHAFKRDSKRLQSAMLSCLENLPLGAAAFSGTHLNLNLESLAKDLGFKAALANSYDAVGDRDFILEALSAFSNCAVHMSRLCQEIIYNSSTNVGLIILPSNWTTGSSIMPNKRNPDTIEITRAKMSRVITASSEAHSIVSAVVPSYGSDLHELKRTFIRSYQELKSSMEIMIPFIKEIKIDENIAKSQLQKGHILATDFANKVTEENNGKFRESYLQTKALVEKADGELRQIHGLKLWPKELSFESSVESRSSMGGTSKVSCSIQIKELLRP